MLIYGVNILVLVRMPGRVLSPRNQRCLVQLHPSRLIVPWAVRRTKTVRVFVNGRVLTSLEPWLEVPYITTFREHHEAMDLCTWCSWSIYGVASKQFVTVSRRWCKLIFSNTLTEAIDRHDNNSHFVKTPTLEHQRSNTNARIPTLEHQHWTPTQTRKDQP